MTTDSRTLYTMLLGLKSPWEIEDVAVKHPPGEVHIYVALPANTRWVCPDCQSEVPIHDHQERRWRHLDTCQYPTIVHARVPRLNCPKHGIKQLPVPWAEPGSRFTALFEALAIDWLRQASISAVSQRLRISWDEASGIQERAVRRGLARRQAAAPEYVGVDETSFQKRHEYVTIVSDLERQRVLYVGDDRTQATLETFWLSLPSEQRQGLKAIAMDMWEPYVQATLLHVHDADEKIVFDKFHIAQHLNRAVDEVRRREHRRLGDTSPLTGSKYDWLRNPASFTHGAAMAFTRLRARVRRVARAWELKETAMALFDLKHPGVADRNFGRWFRWARRSRLEPMKRVALMLKRRWDQVRTYFRHRITNAGAEAVNAKIQFVKHLSRGFRNRDRFRMAIYFHCSGLNLYPAGVALRQ